MPPSEHPQAVGRPEVHDQDAYHVGKPPLPSLALSGSRDESVEIQVPHIIAGALSAAFAATLADRLENELLTHYYLSDQRVDVNLDRVFDRLMAQFNQHIWDELWDYYSAANPDHAHQVSLLFRGPVRQIVLILSGPELSRCVLDRIGPGLSRRPVSWSQTASGIDLALALQLVCRWWHHEHPSRSPGGSPDDIARTLCSRSVSGNAFGKLLSRIRRVLYTPHYVQKNLMDSATWHIITKHPLPPPPDGFLVLQLRLECDPRQRIMEQGHVDIGSFPVVVGTVEECISTTVSQYSEKQWPRCGAVVIRCLTEALARGADSVQAHQEFAGMSVWDDSDARAALSPGLRLVHVEVEEGLIRLTVSAWVLPIVEIMQQMAWTCAALGSSPFPEAVSECRLQIMDWNYTDDATSVNCSLAHKAVPVVESTPSWLREQPGIITVPGFPIHEEE